MLFNGSGYNGKSVLLTIIERFLGKQNVSGETLDRLLHQRFAPGNLFQKMVNVDVDGGLFTNDSSSVKEKEGAQFVIIRVICCTMSCGTTLENQTPMLRCL